MRCHRHLLASRRSARITATRTSTRLCSGNPIDLDLAVPMGRHGGRPEEPRAELRMARRGSRYVLAAAVSSSSTVAPSADTPALLWTSNDSLVPLDVRLFRSIGTGGNSFLHLLLWSLVKVFLPLLLLLLLLLAGLRRPLLLLRTRRTPALRRSLRSMLLQMRMGLVLAIRWHRHPLGTGTANAPHGRRHGHGHGGRRLRLIGHGARRGRCGDVVLRGMVMMVMLAISLGHVAPRLCVVVRAIARRISARRSLVL